MQRVSRFPPARAHIDAQSEHALHALRAPIPRRPSVPSFCGNGGGYGFGRPGEVAFSRHSLLSAGLRTPADWQAAPVLQRYVQPLHAAKTLPSEAAARASLPGVFGVGAAMSWHRVSSTPADLRVCPPILIGCRTPLALRAYPAPLSRHPRFPACRRRRFAVRPLLRRRAAASRSLAAPARSASELGHGLNFDPRRSTRCPPGWCCGTSRSASNVRSTLEKKEFCHGCRCH